MYNDIIDTEEKRLAAYKEAFASYLEASTELSKGRYATRTRPTVTEEKYERKV